MKYLAVIACAILGALLSHQVDSAPTYEVETAAEKKWLSEGIQKFIEHLQQQYEELSKNADDESLSKLVERIKELQQIRDTLETEAATETLKNIQNLISLVKVLRINVAFRLETVQEELKLRALHALQTELDNIDGNIQGLQGLVQRINEHHEKDIQTTHTEILQQWNVWASRQIEKTALATKGNSKSLREAETLVNDLVNEYSALVNSCTAQSLSTVAEYQNAVDQVIERYRSVVVEAGIQTGKCLQADENEVTAEQCNAVALSAQPLSEAAVALASLTYDGVKFLSNRLADSSCVVQTVIEFRVKAFKVARKVDVVIWKSSSRPNNDESKRSSSESNSDSDESSSSGN